MSNFNQRIQPNIFELAKGILNKDELMDAEMISELLLNSEEDKKHAVEHLREMIGQSPKRPVYYLDHEIRFLPEYTRHVVRYAGDYIDQMIKYCSYDKGDFLIFKFRGLRSSLGTNLKKLKKVLPQELHSNLCRFNEIIYVPAKHEMDVEDRPHLFSSTEAVFCLYMVKKLSRQILPFSKFVQGYDANEMYDYHYDKTQKE